VVGLGGFGGFFGLGLLVFFFLVGGGGGGGVFWFFWGLGGGGGVLGGLWVGLGFVVWFGCWFWCFCGSCVCGGFGCGVCFWVWQVGKPEVPVFEEVSGTRGVGVEDDGEKKEQIKAGRSARLHRGGGYPVQKTTSPRELNSNRAKVQT